MKRLTNRGVRGSTLQIILALMGGSVVLLTVAIVLVLMLLMRGPLEGDASHHFGDVGIVGASTTVNHTFVLTNTSDDTIQIDGLRRSCGCTEATYSPEFVQPGEALHVTVALSLDKPGYRDASIEVLTLNGHANRTLFMKANAYRKPGMWSTQSIYRVDQTVTSIPVHLLATTDSETEPPSAPQLELPPQFTINTVGEWQSLGKEPSSAGLMQWGLTVVLDYTGEPVADEASIEVNATIAEQSVSFSRPVRSMHRPETDEPNAPTDQSNASQPAG